MNLFELYAFWKPPIELIEHLEQYERHGRLPASVQAYLNTWRTIRSDYTGAADGLAMPATSDGGERKRVRT